jgi:hypothetical protein
MRSLTVAKRQKNGKSVCGRLGFTSMPSNILTKGYQYPCSTKNSGVIASGIIGALFSPLP